VTGPSKVRCELAWNLLLPSGVARDGVAPDGWVSGSCGEVVWQDVDVVTGKAPEGRRHRRR